MVGAGPALLPVRAAAQRRGPLALPRGPEGGAQQAQAGLAVQAGQGVAGRRHHRHGAGVDTDVFTRR